jgi:hypothetical protein
MPTDREWARAYARQALSDLHIRDLLAEAGAEKCHRLHYLQMAAEKTCKAHLTMGNGHGSLRKTHAYVETVLPVIARHFYASIGTQSHLPVWQTEAVKRLAHEIEVIAPGCDAGDVREDNSEYPWIDGHGEVRIPCEYGFPGIDDGDRTILLLIRLMRAAAEA